MKLSTKNIEKSIRTVKRIMSGEKTTIHLHCLKCGKNIKENKSVSVVNGFGCLNHYHPDCFLKNRENK